MQEQNTVEFDEEIEQEEMLKDRYLTFLLDDDIYAIDISYVTEIVMPQPVTAIPRMPIHIKGIINLRGKIIPLIDVRLKFGKSETVYTEKTCIIVIELNETSLGLIVDQVDEVLTISEDLIISPQEFKMNFQSRYVRGIGQHDGKNKLILDCEILLEEGELSPSEALA